jgi:hypothetical protein
VPHTFKATTPNFSVHRCDCIANDTADVWRQQEKTQAPATSATPKTVLKRKTCPARVSFGYAASFLRPIDQAWLQWLLRRNDEGNYLN